MEADKIIFRGKCIITISIALLLISIGLQTAKLNRIDNSYEIKYESVDIKNMAKAKVTEKKESEKVNTLLITDLNIDTQLQEVELPKIEKVEETKQEETNEEPIVEEAPQQPARIWYLPTEQGRITQYPSYWHEAYDITSPRGSQEDIYPIAAGVISGIYSDNAGALIVTVRHDVNGQVYTSLYAHLSRYADGLYVGKPVSPFDSLGKMGTTGYSTGVHLHLVVTDCAMFDNSDPYCSNLNGFFRYSKQRVGQGFNGLGALIGIPNEWYGR